MKKWISKKQRGNHKEKIRTMAYLDEVALVVNEEIEFKVTGKEVKNWS